MIIDAHSNWPWVVILSIISKKNKVKNHHKKMALFVPLIFRLLKLNVVSLLSIALLYHCFYIWEIESNCVRIKTILINNKKGGLMKQNQVFAYVAAFLYTLITGLSFLFGKISLEANHPIDVLAFRFSAAFLVVVILVIFKVIKIQVSKNMLKQVVPLAIFYPLAFFGFQLFGLQYASSLEAGILAASAPIFTLILATLILKEKTTLLQKVSMLLTVVGVVYISYQKQGGGNLGNLKGIILLLLSSLSVSLYHVFAKRATIKVSTLEISAIMVTLSFIFFNSLALVSHLQAGTLTTFFEPLSNIRFVVAVLYLGVLSSLLTSYLINVAISNMKATQFSVFSNLGVVVSIIAGVIFLHESLFMYHLIGCILIIAGVIGTNLSKS